MLAQGNILAITARDGGDRVPVETQRAENGRKHAWSLPKANADANPSGAEGKKALAVWLIRRAR